ncbi:MAG TPA: hypothetical protein VN238_09750 [Solirubrobacteraceae bacterium]|nr:hypothetical protein [Solirubrobacteraceae bacterium]
MVNAQVRTLHEPDGTPVTNLAFDLSQAQIESASLACGEMLLERHRGQAMDTDAVLALRELTAVCDELSRLGEAQANAHVVLPLARYIVLHDTVDEWVESRHDRGWLRKADEEALPILDAMLMPMSALRGEAVASALAEDKASH